MKKYNLLKVIGIFVIVTWLITLFIPGSYVGYTGEIEKSAIASNGIFGIFSNIKTSISYFNGIAVFLIAVAAFYSILNKISAYERFVDKTTNLFKTRRVLLISLVTVIFGILSLFVQDIFALIVFMPFVYKVMKNLEIDNKAILSSTIVACLIGSMCSIYNNSLFSLFSIKVNTLLLFKVILFVLSIFVLLILIAPKVKSDVQKTKNSKKSKKELVISKNKRNDIIFAIFLLIFTLFIIMSIIPWESLIPNFKAFTNYNEWLNSLKIGKYNIFNNIIGTPVIIDETTGQTGIISVLGNWSVSDISSLLFILTGILGIFAKIKFSEFIETITASIKKILPVAITAMLISVVLVTMVTSGVNITIVNAILSLTKGFNIATSTLASVIGSVFTADFYYYISTIGQTFQVVITDTDTYGLVAFIMQSIYNLMMIIAPTSVGLIIGLYYLNIPYDKWLKFIWKAFLAIFAIVIIMSIIIFMMI